MKKYITTSSLAKAISEQYRKTKNKVNGTGMHVFDSQGEAIHVVSDLNEALKKLNTTLDESQVEALQKVEGVALSDYNDLQRNYNDLQRKIERLQRDYNTLQQSDNATTTELQRKHKELQRGYNDLQQRHKELQLSYNDKTEGYNGVTTELQQSNNKLQQDYNELQQSMQPLQKKHNELQQTNKALKERNAALQEELQRITIDNNSLEQQLQRAAINEQQGLEELQQVIQSNENELVELRRFKRNNQRTDVEKLLSNGWTFAGVVAAIFTVISLFRTLQVGSGGGWYNAFFAVNGALLFSAVMFCASRGALIYNGFKFKLSIAVLTLFYFAAFFIDAKCFAASLQVSDIQFNPYIPAFLVASVGVASVLMKRKNKNNVV